MDLRHRLFVIVASAVLGLAAVGCQGEAATQIPAAATATPTPEAATPSAEPTLAPTPTPAVSPSPEVTATPAPTESPSASPSSPAAFCSGTPANQDYFVAAAKHIKAAVYCPTKLSAGWAITTGSWASSKSGGSMTVTYRYRHTSQTFTIREGAFCLTDVPTCVGGAHVLVANVSFGGLAAKLVDGPSAFLLWVAPATSHDYQMTTNGLSQSAVTAIAANMKVVTES